jgi:uncharacterized protein YndB with AHSA1/START domain
MAARKDSPAEPASNRQIVIERIVDAPRELVWRAWTDPTLLANWWGPIGFTTTIEKMEVRPGGVMQQVMRGPDGTDYPNSSVFVEVVAPERIVYDHRGGRAGDPLEPFQATWTFEALGAKTRITIRMVFSTAAVRQRVAEQYGAIEGGEQTLQRLAQQLAGLSAEGASGHDFVITRVLAAPRELVFQAFTDPEHMQQWWGPKGLTVVSAQMDLRPGGSYHYGMRAPDGTVMWGKFVYREILAPSRLVFVNAFADAAGNLTRHPTSPTWPLELLSTLTFDVHAAGTLLTLRWAPLPSATAQERATFAAAHPSMQQGWSGTLEQLQAYLART